MYETVLYAPHFLESDSREDILIEYEKLWEAYNTALESRMDLHFEIIKLKESLHDRID